MGDDARLLVKVATLYYKGRLSQAEIAERVNLSRQTVGRLLQRASDMGIVQVEIRSPLMPMLELELALEEAFGLKQALVAHSNDDSDDESKIAIGQAAADTVTKYVKSGDVLGIPWDSTTLYQSALRLKNQAIPNLTVVSLTGSAPLAHGHTPTDSLVLRFGKALGAKTVLLPAPAFVDRADTKTLLLKDSNVARVIELGQQANIVLIGIGAITHPLSTYRRVMLGEDLDYAMWHDGAVGEICGHAYTATGERCSPQLSDRTIAIEIDTLHGKPFSIAAAGGAHKVEAIWGALQGRYCNVLITDEAAARGLLEKHRAAQMNDVPA